MVRFSSLLLSKPEAAHKALSDNSLLKNIEFNEKFLGEENITEGRSIFKIFHFIFRLPRNKPKTILSENKHLLFPTAFDLPQRPNEAHIFYGNMSKIVVSLLGSARTSAHIEQSEVLRSPGRQNLQPERCSQKIHCVVMIY